MATNSSNEYGLRMFISSMNLNRFLTKFSPLDVMMMFGVRSIAALSIDLMALTVGHMIELEPSSSTSSGIGQSSSSLSSSGSLGSSSPST